MNKSKLLGDKAEQEALHFLQKQGYRILDKNYRVRGGEIDIVAKDEDQIVFVEVKMRNSNDSENLYYSVGTEKMKHLVLAARNYIFSHSLDNEICRFDVLFIKGSDMSLSIEHVKNAFTLDDIEL